MASIRTGIELQDNFSSVLDNITASVSSAISEMEQIQHTMDAGLDTSAITDATDEIDAATAAARELTEALQDILAPIINREPPIEPHPAPAAQEEVTPQVLANPPPTPDEITVPVVPEISDIPEVTVSVDPVITEQPQLDVADEVVVPVTAEITDQPEINVPDELTVPVVAEVTEQPEIEVPDGLVVPVISEVTQQPEIETPDEITVPVVPEISDIPEPDTSGVRDYTNLINLSENALQKIVDVQNRINNQSSATNLLPDGVENQINNVNAEIQRMQAALNYLRENPIDLGAEVTLLQLDQLNGAINRTLQEQRELNTQLQSISNLDISPVDIPINADVPDPLVDPDQPPIVIPIQWEGWESGSEVFTSTGIERFQSEVQATTTALNRLNTTQERIEQTASQLEILPDNATQDIANLGERLSWITERIQQIENNPLNFGTDEANAELEQLRSQLDAAINAQNDLNQALQDLDVSAANAAYLRLSQTVGNTERYIRDNTTEQGQFNRAVQEGISQADKLTDTIKGAVAAYISVQSVGKALDISDQLTLTT
jgi:predicted  nucleic acid-binding Zn-ribbon protein